MGLSHCSARPIHPPSHPQAAFHSYLMTFDAVKAQIGGVKGFDQPT
jgi:hypothetical protein